MITTIVQLLIAFPKLGAMFLKLRTALMSGCATMRESRIPEFLQELNNHEFNQPQKETIGEILDYVNDLENFK